MEKEVQGRNSSSLTSFRLWEADFTLDQSVFIQKDILQQRKESFIRGVDFKECQMSHRSKAKRSYQSQKSKIEKYSKDVQIMFRRGFSVFVLIVCKPMATCIRGLIFGHHAWFWRMQWLFRKENLQQSFQVCCIIYEQNFQQILYIDCVAALLIEFGPIIYLNCLAQYCQFSFN